MTDNNPVFDHAPWMKHAACRDVTDNRIFFPERGETIRAALQYCNVCPVKAACLKYGFDNNLQGVWGGTSGKQRIKMRREGSPLRLITRPGPPQCGTVGGASAHRRRAESVCTECRQAYREWRARQRQLTVVEGGAA